MKEFYTRKNANDGVKLPLFLPDGTESEHWLIVRGVDSDEFRAAETLAKRGVIDLAQITDAHERAERVRAAEMRCLASLIAGWSFANPLTIDSAVEFIREAPQIGDAVNRFAAQRAAFYKKKSSASVSGPLKKSSSKAARKTQKQPKEST